MRIAFFGLPLAALLLDHDGHEIVLAAISRTDSVGLRRARRRFGKRLLVRPDARNPLFIEQVNQLKPDLVVSWFWTKRLPLEIIHAASNGGIGCHPSLLPRHRGPDPTYWAIASGDTESGVTVHELAEQYDTGDVIAQVRIAIDPDWNAWQLARALDRPGLRLLRETVARVAMTGRLVGRRQDNRLATEAPFPDDEACAIRWSWPTQRVLRHIRALAPAPGAWTEIEGKLVIVLRAVEAIEFPKALASGEAVVQGGVVVVRTGDTAVVLLEGEVDSSSASAGDFVAVIEGARE